MAYEWIAPAVGATVGIATAAGSSTASSLENRENRHFSSREALKARSWQQTQREQQNQFNIEAEGSKYQRAKADMEAAGLNQMMVYGGGGQPSSAASVSPGGGSAASAGGGQNVSYVDAGRAVQTGISSAMEGSRLGAQLKLLKNTDKRQKSDNLTAELQNKVLQEKARLDYTNLPEIYEYEKMNMNKSFVERMFRGSSSSELQKKISLFMKEATTPHDWVKKLYKNFKFNKKGTHKK